MQGDSNSGGSEQLPAAAQPGQRPLWRRLLRLFITIGVLGLLVILFYLAIKVFLGPKEEFETFEYPYEQTFDEDLNVRSWPFKGGSWVQRNSTLAQTVNLADPVQIFMPYKLIDDQPYHASTYFTFSPKAQATGLSFNAQYPDLYARQHLAFISRTESGEMMLAAGYTDEDGGFLPQVQMPFSSEAQEYRLDVYVFSNTYTVELNGQKLIADRPLFYHDGMLGFFSVGPVSYDTLKVTAATDSDPDSLVYQSDFDEGGTGAGWVPFEGDWHFEDGKLVQADANAYDAGIGYEGGSFSLSAYEINFEHLQGIGGGILFNMPSPYQINGAQVVRFSEQADALYWGYFDSAGVFARQGFADITQSLSEQHKLQVFAGESKYDIYLNGELIARDIPAQTDSGHLGLITSRSSAAYSSVEVYPLLGPRLEEIVQVSGAISVTEAGPNSQVESEPAELQAVAAVSSTTPITAATATPTVVATAVPLTADDPQITSGTDSPYVGNFGGEITSSGWRALSSDWAFEDGKLIQSDAIDFDQAIVYNDSPYRDFSLTTSFKHLTGTGAGLLFNMPYSDRLEGSHMVRYSEKRPNAIFWGYYALGGRFVGQGYADVPEAGVTRHTFTVEVGETSYSIRLDGTLIAHSIPLQQDYGYIGLITTLSAAEFDQVEISSTYVTPAGTYTSAIGLADSAVVLGDWVSEQSVITQSNTADADFIYNTGIFASDYTLETMVDFSETSNAGGGVVFHMPERDQKQTASMVRLVDGGQRVLWGSYDETGTFIGKGSADLPSPSSQAVSRPAAIFGQSTFETSAPSTTGHLLKVVVSGDAYDLYINDEMVVEGVALKRQEGWIGLLAHGGPVVFEDLQIAVGQSE